MISTLAKKVTVSLALAFLGLQSVLAQDDLKPIFEGGETPEKTGVEGIKTAIGEKSGLVSTGSVRDLVFKYVNFALPFLALAAFLGFVYAGFLYVTAYGNEDQIGKAKKVMIYAVAGLVLVILSFSIVQVFSNQLAGGIQ